MTAPTDPPNPPPAAPGGEAPGAGERKGKGPARQPEEPAEPAAGAPAAGAPAAERPVLTMHTALENIGLILAPGTLLGAIAFYIGLVQIGAFYRQFGIDARELELTTRDYVVNSIQAAWVPVTGILTLALLVLWVHVVLTSWIARHPLSPRVRALGPALALVGLVLLLSGWVVILNTSIDDAWLPPFSIQSAIALGAALVGYGAVLEARARPVPADRRKARSRFTLAVTGLAVAVILLQTFWVVTEFAEGYGVGAAQSLEANLFRDKPNVVLYSKHRLHIKALGVDEIDLGRDYEPYRFRYARLKLLARSSDKYFVVPWTWSSENKFAFVIPEGESVRIVFAPNP